MKIFSITILTLIFSVTSFAADYSNCYTLMTNAKNEFANEGRNTAIEAVSTAEIECSKKLGKSEKTLNNFLAARCDDQYPSNTNASIVGILIAHCKLSALEYSVESASNNRKD